MNFCELAFLDDLRDYHIWVGFSNLCWFFCSWKINTRTCTELRLTMWKVDLPSINFLSDYDPVDFSKTAS